MTAFFVAEMGMVITDMIIVGRVGSNELAAVELGSGDDGLWWGRVAGVLFCNMLMYWRCTRYPADARHSLSAF